LFYILKNHVVRLNIILYLKKNHAVRLLDDLIMYRYSNSD